MTQNVSLVTQKNKERIRKGRGHRKHTQASKSPLSDAFFDEHDLNVPDPMPVLDSEANTVRLVCVLLMAHYTGRENSFYNMKSENVLYFYARSSCIKDSFR